jgi:AraC-like DNA-binding protein
MMRQIEELAALVGRFAPADGIHRTPIPRLSLTRSERPTEPMHAVHEPALCIVLQGRKRVLLGDGVYHYDASRHLVVSVDLPVVGHVVEASPERPYLGLKLDIDRAMLAAIIMEAGEAEPDGATGPGLAVSPASAELLDAALRLVRLLETPRDIAMLAPLAEREILYRLLCGDDAARLRQIARAESRLQQVSRAIGWIKLNYDKAFSIERVAREANMSASALHLHFKAVTAMSPLQYQKQLRLQEARRLIMSASHDAASAAFKVGYESPSQFSREYRRLFGAPPLRDASRLRGGTVVEMARA